MDVAVSWWCSISTGSDLFLPICCVIRSIMDFLLSPSTHMNKLIQSVADVRNTSEISTFLLHTNVILVPLPNKLPAPKVHVAAIFACKQMCVRKCTLMWLIIDPWDVNVSGTNTGATRSIGFIEFAKRFVHGHALCSWAFNAHGVGKFWHKTKTWIRVIWRVKTVTVYLFLLVTLVRLLSGSTMR